MQSIALNWNQVCSCREQTSALLQPEVTAVLAEGCLWCSQTLLQTSSQQYIKSGSQYLIIFCSVYLLTHNISGQVYMEELSKIILKHIGKANNDIRQHITESEIYTITEISELKGPYLLLWKNNICTTFSEG